MAKNLSFFLFLVIFFGCSSFFKLSSMSVSYDSLDEAARLLEFTSINNGLEYSVKRKSGVTIKEAFQHYGMVNPSRGLPIGPSLPAAC